MARIIFIALTLCSLGTTSQATDEPTFFFKNKSKNYDVSVLLYGKNSIFESLINAEGDSVRTLSDTTSIDSIYIGYKSAESGTYNTTMPYYKFPLSNMTNNTKFYLKFEGIKSDGTPILAAQEGDLFGKTSKSKNTQKTYSTRNNITKNQIGKPEPAGEFTPTKLFQKLDATLASVKNQQNLAPAPKPSWDDATTPMSKKSTSGTQIGNKTQQPMENLIEKYSQTVYSDDKLKQALKRLGFEEAALNEVVYKKPSNDVIEDFDGYMEKILENSWNEYYKSNGNPSKLKFIIKGYIQLKHFENDVKAKSKNTNLAFFYDELHTYLGHELLDKNVFETYQARANEKAMQKYVKDNKLIPSRVVDLVNKFFTESSFKVY